MTYIVWHTDKSWYFASCHEFNICCISWLVCQKLLWLACKESTFCSENDLNVDTDRELRRVKKWYSLSFSIAFMIFKRRRPMYFWEMVFQEVCRPGFVHWGFWKDAYWFSDLSSLCFFACSLIIHCPLIFFCPSGWQRAQHRLTLTELYHNYTIFLRSEWTSLYQF